MTDLAVAGILLAVLLGLAFAAPIWGVDTRDGIESDQSARRAAWMTGGAAPRPGGGGNLQYSAAAAVAGALRAAARRLDADTASGAAHGHRVAQAY